MASREFIEIQKEIDKLYPKAVFLDEGGRTYALLIYETGSGGLGGVVAGPLPKEGVGTTKICLNILFAGDEEELIELARRRLAEYVNRQPVSSRRS